MFRKALSHIRNHCPVKMSSGDATELLKRLNLKYNSYQLECSIDRLSRSNIGLTSIEAISQQIIKRNRQTVMASNRIGVQIVNINLVVLVVCSSHRRNEIFKSIFLHDDISSFANTAAERSLVHIRVLVLDISSGQLLCHSIHHLSVLVSSHTMQISIIDISLSYILILCSHQLLFDNILNLFYMKFFCIRNSLNLVGDLLGTSHHVGISCTMLFTKSLDDCCHNFFSIKIYFRAVSFNYFHKYHSFPEEPNPPRSMPSSQSTGTNAGFSCFFISLN